MSIESEQHGEWKTGGKSAGTSQLIAAAAASQITAARSSRVNDETVGRLARGKSGTWEMMFCN